MHWERNVTVVATVLPLLSGSSSVVGTWQQGTWTEAMIREGRIENNWVKRRAKSIATQSNSRTSSMEQCRFHQISLSQQWIKINNSNWMNAFVIALCNISEMCLIQCFGTVWSNLAEPARFRLNAFLLLLYLNSNTVFNEWLHPCFVLFCFVCRLVLWYFEVVCISCSMCTEV